ncbi:NAD(P)-dependent oxidoreductase [Leuconostoc mesenteroides]|uniref:NAD-dependent epimerase/dehydratase family protein n=1 Tax=Leuconostoc mesenteroides TaxID=1245 RepID=UPI001CBBF4B3|nr:NAD(P)-dependent oxidoreductase [Leuconostoc mesenteroides]MBZ1508265.1 NAD(P)-dependent oxidoreductase [Leuconostoc mesenteroides]MBZ1533921.1 NAD(P)-dependent oxidoreductase [Leuconostoc mesenteroides]UVV92015.1 NAD(P)-dependent oxidoreductase [Leuconostoc mesenteroides]
MKILVTGANGFLGRGIVSEIIKTGNQVVAAGFKTDNVTNEAIHIDGNIFEVENPYEYYGRPDVVLHLAYKDGFILNSDAHVNNFSQHANFIKKIAESGIKRIAVMGTMHEIGFFEGSIDENTPTNPMNFYGIVKDALRNYTSLIAKNNNIEMQWLRAFYIVDGTAYGNSIFSKLYAAAENGQKTFPFTTGKTQYDFLNYEDFAKYVAAAVTQENIQGIINISSGEPMRLSERVEKFIQENKLNIKLEYGAFPDRPFDSKAIWGNNEKLQEILKNQEA